MKITNTTDIEEIVSTFRSVPYHLNGKISGITGNRLVQRCNNGFWTYPVAETDTRILSCDYMLRERNGILLGIKTEGNEDVISYISFVGCDEATAEWAREIMY